MKCIMKLRKSIYIIFFLFAGIYCYSQENDTYYFSRNARSNFQFHPLQEITDTSQPDKRNTEVSLNFIFPFNGFLKNISNLGIGAQFSWSEGRFGRMSSVPSRKFGFTFNAGLDYFFGKRDSYNVRYKATKYFHAYGGVIYNICNRGNFSLTTGPSLELYRGVSAIGFGINLSGNYYFSKCWNLGPTIILMKQANFDPVIAAGIGLTFAF